MCIKFNCIKFVIVLDVIAIVIMTSCLNEQVLILRQRCVTPSRCLTRPVLASWMRSSESSASLPPCYQIPPCFLLLLFSLNPQRRILIFAQPCAFSAVLVCCAVFLHVPYCVCISFMLEKPRKIPTA